MFYISVKNLTKKYISGDSIVVANNNINFNIEEGEFTLIIGPSGSGKTTLLSILGGMETADHGEVIIDGIDITKINEKKLINFRRYDVGFVFQFYNLIQNLTVLENVELATQLSDNPMNSKKILDSVGLSSKLNKFPSQLSGGEQQRVAIARALAKNPKLLLCDEPTGALDYKTGKDILQLLISTCKKENKTLIIITHNHSLTTIADKVILINNSTIKDLYKNSNPTEVKNISW